MPGVADAAGDHVAVSTGSSAKTAPTPSPKALADGVRLGQGAPMGWERGGAGASVPSRTASQPSPTTSHAQMAATTSTTTSGSPLYGIDVSNYQASVNWTSYATTKGDKFAYIKATEGPYCDGTSYKSSTFSSQYSGATAAGLVRGAYHFAIPNCSSGAVQADFFVHNGGGWSPDGKTLPGVLDIEYDPYTSQDRTNSCYGLSQSRMVAWIQAFSREYLADTGVYPIIYSTTGWWTTCTGNSSAFASTNPFWIASYNGSTTSGPGSLPAGVHAWTFWQYGDGASPYSYCGTGFDCDQFNGATSQLNALATTYSVDPHVSSAWTSSMGYPTGKVSKVAAFGVTGYIQRFPNGVALINSKYGTFASSGAILSSWSPTRYGWPTTGVTAVTAHSTSGQQQRFAEGSVTNARAFVSSVNQTAIWVHGAILARYDALGGTPIMGWPLTNMTSQTAFIVKGYIQKFQSGRALISSKYGTFASGGGIYAAWKAIVRGWPTADLRATVYRGRAGWIQTFGRGTTGPDFAFMARGSSVVTWISGTP